jgi:hypothetical protein
VSTNIGVIGIGGDPILPAIHRPQAMSAKAFTHAFMAYRKALLTKPKSDADASIAAFALGMQDRHVRVEGLIRAISVTRLPATPLQIPCARDLPIGTAGQWVGRLGAL